MAKRVVEKKGKIHVTRSGAEVKSLARQLQERLSKDATRVSIAGSIRRRSVEGATDADLVAIPKDSRARERIRDYLRARATKVYQDGDEKFSGRIRGVKVDVVFSEPEEYGAQLLRLTGSSGHNIGLSVLAKKKGLRLSGHGLYKGEKRIAGRTERDIYTALGRPQFKQPWERV